MGTADKKSKRKKSGRKRGHFGAFLLGLIIIGFALYGAYTAVSFGIDKTRTMLDGSEKITEYEKYIEPFVVIDPATFDDVSLADSTDLLDAAISSMIYDSDKLNSYEIYEGEVTGLLVPQEDVEEYFIRMFGDEVKLVNTDVADSFYGVMYNSEKKAYIIPVTSVVPTYTPKIYGVEKKGASIILTVGYIGGTEWAQLEQGKYTAPEPSKYMKITLREDENGYHIGALQSTEAVEIAQPDETIPPDETQQPTQQSTTAAQTGGVTVLDFSQSTTENGEESTSAESESHSENDD